MSPELIHSEQAANSSVVQELTATSRARATRVVMDSALDMMRDAVFVTSTDWQIVDVNLAAARMSGHSRADLRRMKLDELIVCEMRERPPIGAERLSKDNPTGWPMFTRMRRKRGTRSVVKVNCQLVDGECGPLVVVVVQKVQQQRKATPSLSRVRERDYLTSLPTRCALEHRLRRAARRAQERGSQFALVFVDVDGFKLVNDTLGHRAGDLVLQVLSERLVKCLRPCDFAARYGGDEFVVLVENVSGDAEVSRIAGRIKTAVNVPITLAARQLSVSASVGIALSSSCSSVEELLDAADREMYRVKGSKAIQRANGTGDRTH